MRKYLGLIILTLFLVKIGDVMLMRHYVDTFVDEEQFFFDFDFSFEPYTGFHLPANKRYVRTPASELLDIDGLDIQTGDLGYFVDFPLAHPPPKEPNEFRLILTGASVAQGFGVRTNEEMFYRRLEKSVNESLIASGSKKRLRVVNLAMLGSNTFQNYIALNLLAHRLQPDAIATLSGVIDDEQESNMFHGGYQIGGFVYSQRFSRVGWLTKGFAALLPGIVKYSALGQGFRSMSLVKSMEDYRADYLREQPIKNRFERAVSFYGASLKSIVRDFPDIPLIVITQPAADKFDTHLFYEACFAMMADEMKSGRVRIIDAYDYWRRNGGFPGSFFDKRHFSSKGSEILTSFASESIMQMIVSSPKNLAKSAQRQHH